MSMDQTKTRIGPIIAVRPNWRHQVTEEYEFLTSIITSRDGTEQREAMRQTPRITVQFTADQFGDLARRLTRDLHDWPDGVFALPVRWRAAELDGDHPAGSPSLTFTGNLPWWMAAGAKLVIETEDATESVAIASVAGSTVTLESATAAAAPDRSRVTPGWDVRYPAVNTFDSITDEHKQALFRFDVVPGSLPVAVAPVRLDQGAHEGYPCFLHKPNWGRNVSMESDDMREVVDSGRGVTDVSWYLAGPVMRHTFTYTSLTQSRVDELLGSFFHARGRQGFHWFSTRKSDLRAIANAPAETYEVTVDGDDTLHLLDGDPTLTTIVATWPDGAVQFNRIDNMSDVSGDTLITVRNPWEREIDDLTMLSWGVLARLIADRAEVNWITSEIADLTLGFRALKSDWVDTWNDFIGTQIPYNYSTSTGWNDPSEYAEIDFVKNGVPLGAVDRSLCETQAQLVCKWPDNPNGGSLSTSYALQLAFFDEADALITSITPITGFSNRASGEYGEFSINVPLRTIPPGTRYIRVKARMAISYQTWEGEVSMRAPRWGLEYDMEELKWP